MNDQHVTFQLVALVSARRADPPYRVTAERGVEGSAIPAVTVEPAPSGCRVVVTGASLGECRRALRLETARQHLVLHAARPAASVA